ncbi:MAG: squalene/phytoene synthase family protein [Chloroflexi bacterium]|nr:squalene/phytoene synthase family protein [Chloroflexota bacterium]
MSFVLSKVQEEYLTISMKNVSRSFALVTPNVEAPLNDYLSTAYLICRVVDNIEDCTQPFAWQQQRFAEFNYLLYRPEEAINILRQWQQEVWPGLNDDESAMMSLDGGLMLWQIYAHIPEPSRQAIAHWTEAMSVGMEQVQNPTDDGLFVERQGIKLPATEAEYNQYCFIVAGTVGRMATELVVIQYDVDGRQAENLLNLSDSCGRALQKTNILKDFAKDLQRNICFLPDAWLQEADYSPLNLAGASNSWKAAVIQNVLQELDESVGYVRELPLTAVGYRRASLLAMIPAYHTLLLAAKKLSQLFTADHHLKISRRTMAQCILDATRFANNNEAIAAYAVNMHQKVTDTLT